MTSKAINTAETGYAERREEIFVYLQAIGLLARNNNAAALEKIQEAIKDFPNEPIMHMRRIDLLVQSTSLTAEFVEEEVRTELATLDLLANHESIFKIRGSRDRIAFLYAGAQCRRRGWEQLGKTCVMTALRYFPNDEVFLSYLDDSPSSFVKPYRPWLGFRKHRKNKPRNG